MKIGLWSDSVNFPSLPLMKIAEKEISSGNFVEFVKENEHYDLVYLSKIFNLPHRKKIPQAPPTFYADKVIKGGSGYCIDIVDGTEVWNNSKNEQLPEDIEHIYPRYDLYPQFDSSYGFLSRGCCNNCGFCIVSKKEGICSKKVADLDEFWRGQKEICLLDPNILACRDREDLLQQLIDSKAKVDFSQGLDARFITEDVVKLLNQIRIKKIHFAFDLMKNEKQIVKGLECFNQHYEKSHSNIGVYVLTNYDTNHFEDWYRVRKCWELGFYPYVMIYQKGTESQFLTDLSRWSNNRMLFKATSFEDYVPRKDGKSCKELYPQILNERKYYLMPTTTTKTEKPMNAFAKLAAVRREFLSAGAKKTGKNPHAEFMYFELEDIVPVAEPLFDKYGLLMQTSFTADTAMCQLVNVENPQDTVYFSIPLMFIAEPAKFRMNEVQGVGAAVTYYRRYLYMLVLDLVEADALDASSGDTIPIKEKPKKPVTQQERKAVKAEITDTAAPADDLMITALKNALNKLMEVNPENEKFVQEVAVATKGFTDITREKCKSIIDGIKKMLDAQGVK